ncbi:unnamed protein product [Tetraodon nigroviridis]|uniref:(spotted green pufferfish) hypothetical protein n=1 Tax=Tetraodon nigroviridis TaxID=99883 RepID=Q4S3T5_TETNG|nr:unnamed protein product [Tetraodon nigroviridis]
MVRGRREVRGSSEGRQGGWTEPEDDRTLVQKLWGQFNQTNANRGECLWVQNQRRVKNSPRKSSGQTGLHWKPLKKPSSKGELEFCNVFCPEQMKFQL